MLLTTRALSLELNYTISNIPDIAPILALLLLIVINKD
jgi:hypothetical protein